MQRCFVGFLPEIHIALEAVLLKLHAKLTPGWALIQVNFDPMQEIGPKVGDGRSFVSGPFSQDDSTSQMIHHCGASLSEQHTADQ